MVAGVVAVETDQHPGILPGNAMHLLNNLGRNTGTLNHLNARRHRVRLDSGTVMGANINVNAQHLAAGDFRVEYLAGFDGVAHIQQRQQRGAKNERTAVGNPGFNDQVRLNLPNQFLHGHHILGILDNGAALPGEIIRIFRQRRGLHKRCRTVTQRLVGGDSRNPLFHFCLKITHYRPQYFKRVLGHFIIFRVI